jgi:hypothetical protein
MRQQLREALPALALHFSIPPWRVDDLNRYEIEGFMRAIEQIAKAQVQDDRGNILDNAEMLGQ